MDNGDERIKIDPYTMFGRQYRDLGHLNICKQAQACKALWLNGKSWRFNEITINSYASVHNNKIEMRKIQQVSNFVQLHRIFSTHLKT